MSWGRKRETGDRYPSGKLRPKKQAPPPDQPHRRGYGDNPKAATQHGRYLLDGAITPSQWAAGEVYARERGKYRAAVGSPRGLLSRSEGRFGGQDADDARTIERFEAVRRALGRFTIEAEWVLTTDAMLADLTDYRQALDILKAFYGIKQENG